MSSAVVSTSAAPGRHFLFDAESEAHLGTAAIGCPVERSSTTRQHLLSTINSPKIPPASITPASRLEIRPAPEMVTSGIPALDALTGGLPRGCLTEICGSASSGRTSVMLAVLSAATRRGEYCALIDASDALDPQSLTAAGIDLDRMLWVRCNDRSAGLRSAVAGASCPRTKHDTNSRQFSVSSLNTSQSAFSFDEANESGANQKVSRHSEYRLEQVLRATDLLLESGGFGLIVLDLADVPPQAARRIPLTTWFRFRRAVEHKLTILLTIEQQPIAGSCSSLLLQLSGLSARYSALGTKLHHTQLLTGLEINVELVRSRLDRKPARSITFDTKTAWAG